MTAGNTEAVDRSAARAACAALGLAAKNQLGETPRKARILAAAVIRARTGQSAIEIAPRWHIHGPELAPSMLVRAGVTTDLMLTVAEAVDWAASDDAGPEAEAAETASAPTRATDAPPEVCPAPPSAAAKRRAVASVPRPPRPVRPKVRPEVVRYAGWFLDARWRLETVADLFNVDPAALLQALDPMGVEA